MTPPTHEKYVKVYVRTSKPQSTDRAGQSSGLVGGVMTPPYSRILSIPSKSEAGAFAPAFLIYMVWYPSPGLSQPWGAKASAGNGTLSKRAQGSSAQPTGSAQHSLVGMA